jgi:hypothetical protein
MFVGENAIFQQSVQKLLSRRDIIIRTYPHKHQESALDRSDGHPIDPDFGLENALQEGDHAANANKIPLSSLGIKSGKTTPEMASFPP